MSELLSDITKLLNESQPSSRHSLFQLKYFVLGKEPTIQAKLRKSLTELAIRKESLENMELAIEDTKDNIALLDLELLQLKIDNDSNNDAENVYRELDRERINIDIRKNRRKRKNLENQILLLEQQKSESETEAQFFFNAFKAYEQVEPLKPFDDLAANTEIWNEKYTQMLNMTLLLQKPLSAEFINCVLALDKDVPIRKEVINILDQIQTQAIEYQKIKNQQMLKLKVDNLPDSENTCQKKYQV